MRFEAFIHNDDVTCFYVVVQGTQKVVVMGCHNFKDEALIKRWWASQKNKCNGREAQGKKNEVTIETCFRLL
jgi:hypothetical protein